MPEIEKRIFVEEKDLVAEKGDWEARKLSPDARGWTSYCFFLPGELREVVEREIRTKINKTYIQAVAAENPPGVWVRGARFELEAALAVLSSAKAAGQP
ncbi:hypothetical protein K32_21230 [Kaistia sp. 32K]|uniref:hypothetical protein n=1 Tax=Kaistia sp. 32K TaxID=2795690 RepID=UPI0019156C62|nr:hypothetical protein [Kaistia sp. 32K]BCP53506.1 hypothetical protein K32_21230 [Kaistia sp. 32K]